MIYLETERLILRDYTMADKDAYFKLKSDKKTLYYMPTIQLNSFKDAEKHFEGLIKDMQLDSRKYYFLHMELKQTREQLGSIGYTVTEETPVGKMVNVGGFIYPRYWNMGYMTEAMERLLEFAFNENDVYRITTSCLADNKGSEKVMQKSGMIKEAERKKCAWHDGELKDRVEYRLLKEEWNVAEK